MKDETYETQYRVAIDLKEKEGLTSLGLMTNFAWHSDPKHLLFTLSRYKFVAKMLSGKKKVLEIGCADAFGTRIVLQETKDLTALDIDPLFVKDTVDRMDDHWKFNCQVHDMLEGPLKESFEGAYTLDVLEHIPKEKEERFIGNIADSMTKDGVLIIGTPSIQSQVHASKASKEGHINCKDHKDLRELILRFFHNVFIFSMNDEIVHTGFYPMANYLFAVGCSKRK